MNENLLKKIPEKNENEYMTYLGNKYPHFGEYFLFIKNMVFPFLAYEVAEDYKIGWKVTKQGVNFFVDYEDQKWRGKRFLDIDIRSNNNVQFYFYKDKYSIPSKYVDEVEHDKRWCKTSQISFSFFNSLGNLVKECYRITKNKYYKL